MKKGLSKNENHDIMEKRRCSVTFLPFFASIWLEHPNKEEMYMKRKHWILIVLAVVILAASAVLVAMSGSVGRFLRSDSGRPMIVCNYSPNSMSTRTERDIFRNLETGDKIWVLHSAVAESYPGRMRVYAVIRLGKGSIADIPQDVIDELRGLGWLAEEDTSPT